MTNFIGIDPGKSGGIAVLYATERQNSFAFRDATERDIWDWITVVTYGDNQFFGVIERVSASPQMGVVSAFTFGRSLGFLRGVLIASRIPFDEVSPQKWQKVLGCLSRGNKNVTKQKAQQLFPNVKVTHANADALLLAEYARRTYVTNEKQTA